MAQQLQEQRNLRQQQQAAAQSRQGQLTVRQQRIDAIGGALMELAKQADEEQERQERQNAERAEAEAASHRQEQASIAPSAIAISLPANGTVIKEFNLELGNKGMTIAGSRDDPIHAAADGEVVYAGSGLRGYGRLIIIKHSSHILTSYGHNERLLVKEGQKVSRGQFIATMGDSEAPIVQVGFEVRVDGKPVDPRLYIH